MDGHDISKIKVPVFNFYRITSFGLFSLLPDNFLMMINIDDFTSNWVLNSEAMYYLMYVT